MIHDRLRKNPQSSRPHPVDGVLNAPKRSTSGGPTARTGGSVGFHGNIARPVDGFRRAEGFHAANQTNSRAPLGGKPDTHHPGQQESILHMSLPGGSLSSDSRHRGKHKKTGKWHSARRWARRSGAVVGGLAVLIGGFLFAKAYFSAGQVFQGGGQAAALSCSNEVEPADLSQEGDGRINILLLGEDNEASLTDSILIASVDPINKTSSMVSIPRDMWVTTDSTGSTKVNAVFPLSKKAALNEGADERAAAKAAVQELKSVAEQVLGVSIHYYVTVDVAGFERAVDIVGGVTMDVPEELAVSEHMWDDVRNEPYYLDVPEGKQEFDPQRALFFVRSRKTSTRGDFDRSERQRLFLRALSSQLLSAGTYANPVRMTKLMDAFSDNVVTSFSVDDAWCLAKTAQEIDAAKMESVDLADREKPVVTTGNVSGQSIVQPLAGVENYDEIHKLIRSSFVDGYIARENARIVVLNGSNIADRAKTTGQDLKSHGYNVTHAGNAASQDFQSTTVVNLRGDDKRYTQHYLEKRFGVSAADALPDGITLANEDNADIVIILGNNNSQ